MREGQANPPGGPRRITPSLLLPLDRQAAIPLFRQIYTGLRQAILSGRVTGGMRLPATRHLAADLGVARTTVVLAYEQLLAEGYLCARGAAGTVVATLKLPQPQAGIAPVGKPTVHSLATAVRPFQIGEPALDVFPITIWARLYARRARSTASDFLGYSDGTGYFPLRRAIADYTSASRGVRASPDQVILVRGAQQAVDLVARVLLRPGDTACIEDPGYPVARRLFERAGASIVAVPLDREGMRVDIGMEQSPDARIIHVAPSHQFPLGSIMSLGRRLALLAWADRARGWVVEDDYDSEFRYPGHPVSSLQGLDAGQRVIYVGTFSKTVFPSLRLGYLIVPPELVDVLLAARVDVDHVAPTLEQTALADFIEEGHFTRHIRRMRTVYRARQDALLAAAAEELDGLMLVEPADAGMHAVGWLSDTGANDRAIADRALALGVETRALSSYCVNATLPPALLLGFAAVRPRAMAPALRLLRKAIAG